MAHDSGFSPISSGDVSATVPPSGAGCAECEAIDGWWVHLRRCAACGHVGCCDSSPGQHATGHYAATGHPIMASFEPGESWFWSYRDEAILDQTLADTVVLAVPTSHPVDQAAPGPADRLPANWRELIH